jgi:aspartyl-tRNA(Asn)/glutamyl-tRNA(Gln) amidotransferase subunit C
MKVSEKDVLYVADLANLELTEAERARMLKDLNSILDYIDMLSQVDTKEVEPMAQVVTATANDPTQAKGGLEWGTRLGMTAGGMTAGGAMRADEVKPGLTHEQALMNAPDTDGTYFKVPKVIDKSGEVTE